ncbi:uncharacterized protein MICPUCDRAFT_50402 [Micromonas pusilla CCMP1545]|jgi:hypothetical protein|uniref:Predicted protein n=1 Tax=Micromonas pusilla (strain CCMP1545) TaxID=564608 RepID=C1MI19_MICPC|nr:uncharacterized protein MICPUCDRAFT_50402 [Micromonas pusilla CCMP1545]EEH60842.1 predicted protein [Micromonas pusilla CCMP1545]|eukprot:XP_003055590.1 predicted protein [Micromonas pusilla CCMP1545]
MPPRAPRARRGNALKQKTAAEENVESAPTRATAPMVSPKAVGSTARGDAPVAEKMPPTTATDAPAEGDARALLEKELADLDSERAR